MSLQDVYPLTPLQDGLLFHALLDEGGFDAYTSQLVIDLPDDYDAAVVRAAGQALLDRHPNLRAAFRQRKSGETVALVPARVELPWREADVPPDELDAFLAEEQRERFDFARPPLLRATLVRGADKLVLTHHHILLDGWSVPLLVAELRALYRGDDLASPPPYRDHLAWLARQDADAARVAWADALAGLDEPTRVAPADPDRVPEAPGTVRGELPASTTAALVEQARAGGWTFSTAVQAAWALVLARLTGRDDVVFGTTVSGRPAELPGVAEMVGLFINTVPVRMRLSPAEPVGAALRRLQDEQARLLDHQHLSLAEIQRVAGHGELFDTVTVIENWPGEPGLDVRDAMHYPLYLVVRPGDQLTLRVHHQPGVIDAAIAERAARWVERILAGIAADPEQLVSAIDGLDAAERALAHASGEIVEIAPATLLDAFDAHVAATPDALAVVAGDERVSYAELDRRASALASRLCELGAGPERFVAVAIPRSVELMVALVGVLKAGAAYLPLDLDYPAERVEFMLADSGASLLVTADGVQRLADAPGLPGRAGPDNAAYLIYTSGSTGRPKGVVVTHRAIVNRLDWMQDRYQLDHTDRVLQKTPASFDVSVWEFFLALRGAPRWCSPGRTGTATPSTSPR